MIPTPGTKSARAYILLPGIKTQTDDNNNWAPAMASAINITHDCAKADEFRYHASAIFHRWGMQERVGYVIDLAYRYWSAGYKPILVAHSDGCEIVRQVIIAGPSIIRAAHLIAGACEADFAKNGLNDALRIGKVAEIYCYVSKGDKVIDGVARNSVRFFSWLGIAYGTLGFDGPENVAPDQAGKVHLIERRSLKHGDWFVGAHWQTTFNSITQLENDL